MKAMDTLLARYEQGELTRRQLLQGLAVVAAPVKRQASSGVLRGRNINHVNLRVADVDRSVDFYRHLFSLPRRRLIPGRPDVVDLPNGNFIALGRSDQPGTVDHFDIGVEDFDPGPTGEALRAGGIDEGLVVGPDFVFVTDPDGVRVQISTPEWTG